MAKTKNSHRFKGLTIKIQLKRMAMISRTEDQTKNIKIKQWRAKGNQNVKCLYSTIVGFERCKLLSII
jgi:hypothetical protein